VVVRIDRRTIRLQRPAVTVSMTVSVSVVHLATHTMQVVSYLPAHLASFEYERWRRDYEGVRYYLLRTNEGMSAWFDARWRDADRRANEIFDRDVHDSSLVADLFDSEVVIWPDAYFLQLSAAVIKDACTLYEVFLERTADAVLQRFWGTLATLDTEDSWRWNDCATFYASYLHIDVRPPAMEAILWTRNKMTHLRSELRTEAGQAEFEAHLRTLDLNATPHNDESATSLTEHKPYFTHGVWLTQLQTLRILDQIADIVTRVAAAAFPFEYGKASSSHLAAVRAGSLLPVPGLPAARLIRLHPH
jgi:hypothetical protein